MFNFLDTIEISASTKSYVAENEEDVEEFPSV